jgi:DNA-binding transcriptional LysR family regulator
MINLEYYRVFYYVAKLGSITMAAEELFISQPAVSQAVRHLEDTLGGSLFLRTPKGVRLTPEGEVLYSYVSRGYEYLMQAESKYRELLNLEDGEVRIGASDMTLQFYLLPQLERFHKAYPKIRIQVTNASTPDTLELLRSGRIDFGAVSSPVNAEKGLKLTPVCGIRDIFMANDRFAGLKGRTVEPSELLEHPIICLERNTSTRRHVDAHFSALGISLGAEFELATSELIVQFALRGLGVGCVVGNFAEKHIASGELFEIMLSKPVPERSICLAYYEEAPMSPAGRKLLKAMIGEMPGKVGKS